MKIERLNENQIRCTLTREDLSSREIKLNELVYGSEKIKLLFRDMMQQASDECGFDANNTSLMIEAIPLSADSIVLIVTKVDDPEELDGRFARFTAEDVFSDKHNQSFDNTPGPESLTGVDDILDLITRLSKARKNMSAAKSDKPEIEVSAKEKKTNVPQTASASDTQVIPIQEAEPDSKDAEEAIYRLTRFYLFRDLQTLIHASRAIDPAYEGPNSLYKNPDDGNLYLILQKADTSAQAFNKLCNALSEYGVCVDYTDGLEELFGEHMKTILAKEALQTLRSL